MLEPSKTDWLCYLYGLIVLAKVDAGCFALVTSIFGTSYEPGPGVTSFLNDYFLPIVKALDLLGDKL